jgi:hypothetical protein
VNFDFEQHIDAPPDAVAEALVNPAFIAATAGLPRLGEPELLDQHRDGDRVLQRVRYRFTGDLGAAVTAFVDPDRLSWVDVADFELSARRSRHRIVPDHYPHRLVAAYATVLEPEGKGSWRFVTGSLRVLVLLVGGRAERAIVSGLEEHAAAEAELLERWLAASP